MSQQLPGCPKNQYTNKLLSEKNPKHNKINPGRFLKAMSHLYLLFLTTPLRWLSLPPQLDHITLLPEEKTIYKHQAVQIHVLKSTAKTLLYLAGAGTPQVNACTQPNTEHIKRRPVHQVKVKIILQLRSVKYFKRDLWNLSSWFSWWTQQFLTVTGNVGHYETLMYNVNFFNFWDKQERPKNKEFIFTFCCWREIRSRVKCWCSCLKKNFWFVVNTAKNTDGFHYVQPHHISQTTEE